MKTSKQKIYCINITYKRGIYYNNLGKLWLDENKKPFYFNNLITFSTIDENYSFLMPYLNVKLIYKEIKMRDISQRKLDMLYMAIDDEDMNKIAKMFKEEISKLK